ncbi:UBX domain-containing protein 6 [Morus notabilis]|uniref:UBX domain-containing protein 6 n=1 Tax=Morus notabilis TaxID=981085 RepID=W9S5N5_9ROSA|nr:UBX domain-containing protein 6 [Morus notabilis]
MDDVKDKVKGFMKKVNSSLSSSSSSSGKFKGQGRVLGSASSGPSNPIPHRSSQIPQSKPLSAPNSKPANSPKTPSVSDQRRSDSSNPDREPANGFDPFDTLITIGKRSQNGYSVQVFECPICGQSFRTEEEVSEHVESCVNNNSDNTVENGGSNNENDSSESELEACIGAFLSGELASGSVEIVFKLLNNVVREPENAKFRRIRMGNAKIKEAVVDVAGGVELLEFVGFELKEEDGEMWAAMEVPSEERIRLIKHAIRLLEPQKVQEPGRTSDSKPVASVEVEEKVEPKKIDRQILRLREISEVNKLIFYSRERESPISVTRHDDELVEKNSLHQYNKLSFCDYKKRALRSSNSHKLSLISARSGLETKTKVFFSVPENVAAKIELPDSFYNLSLEEVKREAEMRKKKLADSQLLIPKSYKEKQAKAAKRRYKRTIIRIQFPDGVVLQGIFNPWEPTSSLYQFVSSALKEPSLEFELLHPLVIKRRVIPCFPAAGQKPTILEDEDLVPAALVKFRPIETDSLVFTGLRNELLEIMEPLVVDTAVALA